MGTVWWDKNITTLSALTGLSTINLGDDSQAADPFWVTNHPGKSAELLRDGELHLQ